MAVSTQAPTTSFAIPEAISRTTWNERNGRFHRFWHCQWLNAKTAALLTVLFSFAIYLTVNAFFLITLRLLAAYFTLLAGTIFYALFMFGYRRNNRWMVFAYFIFLGIFVAVLAVILSFSLDFLRDPKYAPLVYLHDEFRFGSYSNTSEFYEKNPGILRHDIVLYKVMFMLSCASLLITSLCIPVVYRFFKYLCDRHTRLTATNSQHRSHCNCDARSRIHHRAVHTHQRHNTAESGSICVISYPPPCPPAYEVEPTVHTPPRRPHHKTNSPRSELILPQYTDFRPEVYAEPPQYEEKPPIDGDQ